MSDPMPLVAADALRVEFVVRGGARRRSIHAVDGVSFTIGRGEILALVGESGCGKSTTGRALLRLCRPSGGTVTFDGIDITRMSHRRLRPMRRRLQMIFQHPGLALNPRALIAKSIAEPLEAAGVGAGELRRLVDQMLEKVGLPMSFGRRYPHELSGGQLQRVAIARALVARPDFVVADEPLASLDLSVQAQVMVQLKELQAEFGVSLLFITHDLAAAEYLSNRVAVMYLGKLVECAPAHKFSSNAKHPYSQGLINAIPRMDPVIERSRPAATLRGEVPSPLNPPTGCRFHTRCPLAMERCSVEEPPLKRTADGHDVACWAV